MDPLSPAHDGPLSVVCVMLMKRDWKLVIRPSKAKWLLLVNLMYWICLSTALWVGNAGFPLSLLVGSVLLTAFLSIYYGLPRISLSRDWSREDGCVWLGITLSNKEMSYREVSFRWLDSQMDRLILIYSLDHTCRIGSGTRLLLMRYWHRY